MTLIASSQLTVIIGLGLTGLSAARFLHKRQHSFVVMDSRDCPPNIELFKQEFPEARYLLGKLDSDVLTQADEIIISPGMSLQTPELAVAIAAGVPVIGDVELFARYVQKPVIAITGSNAKSTVTTLVGEMAVACGYVVGVCGNIGVPVLELIDDPAIDLFVLELSSFQLETTFSLKPVAATILNVSADHMDRYASLMEYHQAKQRIYRNAETIVVNRQDVLTIPPLAKDSQLLSFGNDRPDRNAFGLISEGGDISLAYQFEALLSADELYIRGKLNLVNALAALALGTAAGFDQQGMLRALKIFKGLPHRCQYISTIDNVNYINDSKATNIGATLAALESFSRGDNNIVLITGGQAKGADFSDLKAALVKSTRYVILIGGDALKIQDVIDGVVPYETAATLREALTIAKGQAQSGDTVLLSPACASFDMFSGFEDRGNQFVSLVKEVAA